MRLWERHDVLCDEDDDSLGLGCLHDVMHARDAWSSGGSTPASRGVKSPILCQIVHPLVVSGLACAAVA